MILDLIFMLLIDFIHPLIIIFSIIFWPIIRFFLIKVFSKGHKLGIWGQPFVIFINKCVKCFVINSILFYIILYSLFTDNAFLNVYLIIIHLIHFLTKIFFF